VSDCKWWEGGWDLAGRVRELASSLGLGESCEVFS
jgi:hypothetical protein